MAVRGAISERRGRCVGLGAAAAGDAAIGPRMRPKKKMRRRASRCNIGMMHAHIMCMLFSIAANLPATMVNALPKPNGSASGDGKPEIFTNLNDNYQSSSEALDVVTKRLEGDIKVRQKQFEDDMKVPLSERQKRLEDDIKEGQEKAREYWKETFEEIKASNPTVFGENGVGAQMRKKRETDELWLERWKEYLDSGGSAASLEEEEVSRNGDSGREGVDSAPSETDAPVKVRAPLRFDGFQTWEKQLQQWSEDVEAYRQETEEQLNELLQPKEPSGYDLGSFGVSSSNLKSLVADEADGERTGKKQTKGEASRVSKPTLAQRLGLDSTATPIGTLPIALTALDKSLPPIPKPRPVAAGEAVLPHTDIADKSKNIWIVTTGALPWMTGTAVNPLLRAAYLSSGRKAAGGSVTLMLPWVEREADQERVYGKEKMFASPEDQEEYIRTWLRDTANMKEASEELNIKWYTAWQEVLENSLYSMGDIIGLIPEEDCDICVLEEPEHLNWYRAPGENWTSKFKHVVGIVHTNYFVYATEQPAAFIRAPGMRLLSSWMCRAHCHRLIKLSGTLQQFAPEKELVENVHGVRRTFLDVGEDLRTKLTAPVGGEWNAVFGANAAPTVYFIGKMLWSKGLDSLMDLMKYAEESAGLKVKIDMYGSGPNKDEASAKAEEMGLDMPFHGPIDHAELGWTHKVFINPSLSEVLCTTVAEALAMGKFVVLPSHPSNDFFAQFPNCLPYSNKEEFVGNLYYALTHSPEPLTEEYSHALSWEAATERFAAAGSVSVAEAEAMEQALSSTEAGIDIVLPPLTADEEQRKKLSRSFRKTRERYRSFRSRLSQELSRTNVLPTDVQQRFIAELDKRLDVDLDELLSSPKLRVKLSPAKLDKLLLELYDSVTQGASGDVFRVVGGGSNVGRQTKYMQQQQSKLEKNVDDPSVVDGGETSTATSLVKRALKRNFPHQFNNLPKASDGNRVEGSSREDVKMSLSGARDVQSDASWRMRLVPRGSFTQSRPPRAICSPLI